jgi:hypothetical protein
MKIGHYLIIFDNLVLFVIKGSCDNLINDENKIEIRKEKKMNEESVSFQKVLKENKNNFWLFSKHFGELLNYAQTH